MLKMSDGPLSSLSLCSPSSVQVKPAFSTSLFHVSNTSECYRGERVILSKYLEDVHSFHHLITTQVHAQPKSSRKGF